MEWNGMEWNGMEWNGIESNRIDIKPYVLYNIHTEDKNVEFSFCYRYARP